ncbi:DinB superfamily protein [Paenibacillus sp. 1_12]|uniref:DinB family protein n=1 Tax=Paenibacillus sp. 1_12 TaxID=1566278 RepID=UPI0008E27715|nr:DinB family protein [Paenibacillus sp. 1_12]SFL75770.1 DinB superfamily protein [Paenibacillus sp. 1_12]
MTVHREAIVTYKQFAEWVPTLLVFDERDWLRPIAVGKASVGEIISHLMNWDRYLIETILPAVKRGEGMVFPDFDSFNKSAYVYANSGVSRYQLLDEFTNTRLELVELLLAMSSEDLDKPVTANGISICPHTGAPYCLGLIIQEFNEHDRHHQKQILHRT